MNRFVWWWWCSDSALTQLKILPGFYQPITPSSDDLLNDPHHPWTNSARSSACVQYTKSYTYLSCSKAANHCLRKFFIFLCVWTSVDDHPWRRYFVLAWSIIMMMAIFLCRVAGTYISNIITTIQLASVVSGWKHFLRTFFECRNTHTQQEDTRPSLAAHWCKLLHVVFDPGHLHGSIVVNDFHSRTIVLAWTSPMEE